MNVTFPDGQVRAVSGVIPRPGSSGATRDEWDRLVAHCNPVVRMVQWEGPSGYSGTSPPTVNLIAPALEWEGPSGAAQIASLQEFVDAENARFEELIARGACGWLLVYDAPGPSTVRFLTFTNYIAHDVRAVRTVRLSDPYNMPLEHRATTTPIAGLSSDWVPHYQLIGGVSTLRGYSRVVTRNPPGEFARVSEAASEDEAPWWHPQRGEWWPRPGHKHIGETVQAPAVTFDVTDTAVSGATVLAPWVGSETAVNAMWRAAVVA